MTALQKKVLAGLEKTKAAAQKNLKRDSALLKSYGAQTLEFLVQRHKSIINLCEKEISILQKSFATHAKK